MIQSVKNGFFLFSDGFCDISCRVFGPHRSRDPGGEGVIADVRDHVGQGLEPDTIERAQERNLAEVVLPDLKGDYFDDPLNPMSR